MDALHIIITSALDYSGNNRYRVLQQALKKAKEANMTSVAANKKSDVIEAELRRLLKAPVNEVAKVVGKTDKPAIESQPKQPSIERQLQLANEEIARLRQQLDEARNELAEYDVAMDNMGKTITALREERDMLKQAQTALAESEEFLAKVEASNEGFDSMVTKYAQEVAIANEMHTDTVISPKERELLAVIEKLELDYRNYIPFYAIAEAAQITEITELHEILWALEANDKVELSSVAEPMEYTEEQRKFGAPQYAGGDLFFAILTNPKHQKQDNGNLGK